MFLLWLRQLPQCGDRTPALVPPPAEGRSSPTNTAVFPPSSFVLPSFAWFYIFFSTSQVLLSILSWWSACTSVYEVYCWCIHGERCTPCPLTPPPSCSQSCSIFEVLVVWCVVGHCCGEELSPFCWPVLAAGVAVFGASHRSASQI